jgi:hypothetical protein
MQSNNRKSEIFYLDIEKLNLDDFNPRLYGDVEGKSQEQIIEFVYNGYNNIDELAGSLAANGYFSEEPIIVIPKNEIDFITISSENSNNYEYIVVEGNRRITSIKLLLNKQLQEQIEVDDEFPQINSVEIENNLKKIPCIIYEKRSDVDTYLSIRHISGNKTWGAFAKAKYIYNKVTLSLNSNDNDIEKSIIKLASQIGDKSDVIRRNYIYYKVFEAIEQDILDYKSKHVKDRFSLIQVSLAYGNTNISKYIGLPPFKNLDLNKDLITSEYIENLDNLTKWVFGKREDGSDKLISDSRNITSLLNPILGKSEATEHLKNYDDLEGAFELTDGEKNLVIGNVRKSIKLLNVILKNIGKFDKDKELKKEVDNLEYSINQIKKLLA